MYKYEYYSFVYIQKKICLILSDNIPNLGYKKKEKTIL